MATILAALASGCLAAKLRGPSRDHYLQAQTIANRCAADGGSAELCEDADAMAKQACYIAAIVDGNDGKQCEEPAR